MAHTINNNFKTLKADFKTDTGKNADENIELYIHYFNARMLDKIMQYEHITQFEVLNKITQLPGILRLEMADMIRNLKKDSVI